MLNREKQDKGRKRKRKGDRMKEKKELNEVFERVYKNKCIFDQYIYISSINIVKI